MKNKIRINFLALIIKFSDNNPYYIESKIYG